MSVAQQMKTEFRRNPPRKGGHVGLDVIEEGGAYLHAGIAFDAAAGLLYHPLQSLPAALQWGEVAFPPAIRQPQHRLLPSPSGFDAGGIWNIHLDGPTPMSPVYELRSLLAADLDECGLSHQLLPYSPLPAGQIGIPGYLDLAAPAVASSAVSCLLYFGNGQVLFLAVILNVQVALVHTLFIDQSGVDQKQLRYQPSGHCGSGRPSAVQSDHKEIIQIHLAPFSLLVDPHHIAAFESCCYLQSLCPLQIFAKIFRKEKGALIDGPGGFSHLLWVSDQNRPGIEEVLSSPDTQDTVHHTLLQGELQKSSNRPT